MQTCTFLVSTRGNTYPTYLKALNGWDYITSRECQDDAYSDWFFGTFYLKCHELVFGDCCVRFICSYFDHYANLEILNDPKVKFAGIINFNYGAYSNEPENTIFYKDFYKDTELKYMTIDRIGPNTDYEGYEFRTLGIGEELQLFDSFESTLNAIMELPEIRNKFVVEQIEKPICSRTPINYTIGILDHTHTFVNYCDKFERLRLKDTSNDGNIAVYDLMAGPLNIKVVIPVCEQIENYETLLNNHGKIDSIIIFDSPQVQLQEYRRFKKHKKLHKKFDTTSWADIDITTVFQTKWPMPYNNFNTYSTSKNLCSNLTKYLSMEDILETIADPLRWK